MAFVLAPFVAAYLEEALVLGAAFGLGAAYLDPAGAVEVAVEADQYFAEFVVQLEVSVLGLTSWP